MTTMRKTYDISAYSPLKPGTRVKLAVWRDGAWQYEDGGKVVRWTKVMGQRNWLPAGYEPVLFDTGGTLMVHRESLMVTAN